MIIIKSLLLANLITKFEPLQWIIELLPNNLFKYVLIVLTSCLKCCTTWTTYLLTNDLYLTAIAFFIANMYTYILNDLELLKNNYIQKKLIKY